MERLLMKRNKNHKGVIHGWILIKESCDKEPETRNFEEGQGEPEQTELSQVVFPDQDMGGWTNLML